MIKHPLRSVLTSDFDRYFTLLISETKVLSLDFRQHDAVPPKSDIGPIFTQSFFEISLPPHALIQRRIAGKALIYPAPLNTLATLAFPVYLPAFVYVQLLLYSMHLSI